MAGSGNFLSILGGFVQWFVVLCLLGWFGGREVLTTMLFESRPMRADAGLSAGLASTMIHDQLCSIQRWLLRGLSTWTRALAGLE